MKDKISYLTDVSIITCIVAVGRGDAVLLAAQAMGAAGAMIYHARGIGPRERLGLLGIAVEAEKEVITILVPTDYQDTIFEAVYRAAELNAPGAGLAYITPVEKLATYIPREILGRIGGEGEPE